MIVAIIMQRSSLATKEKYAALLPAAARADGYAPVDGDDEGDEV